jgi:nucleoid DNA-binding protein
MAKESKKPLNKAGVLAHLAEASGLGKKEVGAVLEALCELAQEQLSKKGPGVFIIPNVIKLSKRVKPATPARKGINPFTKEPQMFKAKPASVTVKGNALKKFKEAIK